MIMKGTGAIEGQKWRKPAIVAGVISLLVAAIVIVIGWYGYARENQEERERLILYWMRYAASYYEYSGQWLDFPERLLADAGRYPGEKAFRLIFTDTQGIEVAQVVRNSQGVRVTQTKKTQGIKGAQGSSAVQEVQVIPAVQEVEQAAAPATRINGEATRTKPIIVHREIVGYVDAKTEAGQIPGAGVWWLAIAAAAGSYVLLILWQAIVERNRRGQIRVLTEQAQRLGRVSGDGPLLQRSDSLESLYVELERVRMRVQQLETVRRSMVADIAHELRTPLSVMRTQLDNALQAGGKLIAAQTAALYDETMRMSKLVHDLQELALAETGHLPLDKEWFSLSELAGSVIDMLSVEAEDLGLELSSQVKCEVRLYGDQGRIRQALINLVGNALRHARREVHIVIGLQGDRANVEIYDDGWGIEEEELPHIFERFYRGQTSSSTYAGKSGNRSGLGLGLAIAEQYARAHGGRIEVISRWGEGATFILTLPVIKG